MSHHSLKLRLIERLHELGIRLEDIDKDLDQPHSKDWEDMAIEREGEEVLERLGESGLAEIGRIRSALARMAKGEYGICQSCGGEISQARLEAVPDAPLCINCASGKTP
ncbi:TraR/DksA family transcriptional regulator [Thetidibacter halocola]|uniref:TraR/DksA family transcriptional regulator n=1 Tax=Thetidibacter halocola TaxID=2827239 RepID=A0A8J8BAM6_9RHOB|nr:TraR/DksA family transcriptional regulator [Thetidibacter halocola]MBS0126735.1 TraR/DksA family transcriptional regulator [Thetidibacter halocola]